MARDDRHEQNGSSDLIDQHDYVVGQLQCFLTENPKCSQSEIIDRNAMPATGVSRRKGQ